MLLISMEAVRKMCFEGDSSLVQYSSQKQRAICKQLLFRYWHWVGFLSSDVPVPGQHHPMGSEGKWAMHAWAVPKPSSQSSTRLTQDPCTKRDEADAPTPTPGAQANSHQITASEGNWEFTSLFFLSYQREKP